MAGDFQLALFRALLDTGKKVDRSRLRTAATTGVPDEVRPAVWNYLLGVSKPNNAADPSLAQHQAREYAVRQAALDLHTPTVQRIRAALKRARVVRRPAMPASTSHDDVPAATTPQSQKRASGRSAQLVVPDSDGIAAFTRVIALYLSGVGDNVEFHSDMVYIAAPFLEVMPTEAEAYYAFAALMQKHDTLFTSDGLNASVTEFLSIFRYMYHDLHELFVAEEVDMRAWVPSWLRSLLARQMPRDTLLRLWDAYFTALGDDWTQLHPYVCLVLVGSIRGDLQDCEDGERILSILSRPKLLVPDPSRLLANARTAREQLKGAGFI